MLPPVKEMATAELRRALEGAEKDAQERGNQSLTIQHLVRAILLEPIGAEILRESGADVDVLDRELARFVDMAAGSSADSPVRLPRAQVVGGSFNTDAKPSRYQVIFHNDKYTTREFVIEILMSLFSKTKGEAVAFSTAVHEHGSGIAGEYEFKVARRVRR